jgi:uncharacterized lipoprotein YmbA
MLSSIRVGLVIVAMLILASCSSESLKRNTYHSLQIMKQRECQQQPGKDCPEPESYNKYEKQREEELKK